MSHECPPAVRPKLRDQRVRKHARRTWSVGEVVRAYSWCKALIGDGLGSAGTDRTNALIADCCYVPPYKDGTLGLSTKEGHRSTNTVLNYNGTRCHLRSQSMSDLNCDVTYKQTGARGIFTLMW